MLNLGEKCKKYRLLAKKSQGDVSRDTGYCQQTISNFECNRSNKLNLDLLEWYIKNTDFAKGGVIWL